MKTETTQPQTLSEFKIKTDIFTGENVIDAICLLGAMTTNNKQREQLEVINSFVQNIWHQMTSQQFPNGITEKTEISKPTTTTPQTLKGFTEGEWYIEQKYNGCAIWSDISTNGSNRTIIASIYPVNQTANAELIASAPTLLKENEQLRNEIEVLKHNRNRALSLALEFGYKQCEKGENIQTAFLNYYELINERKSN